MFQWFYVLIWASCNIKTCLFVNRCEQCTQKRVQIKILGAVKTITTKRMLSEHWISISGSWNEYMNLETEHSLFNVKTWAQVGQCNDGNEGNKFPAELSKEILDDSWDTHIYLNSSGVQCLSIKLSSSAIIWSQSLSKAPSSVLPSHPCSSGYIWGGWSWG